MSNLVIGTVYSAIIDKIIAESKDDFEAAGLDQDTLQELKQTWQTNISNLEIAQCPWDPPPPQQQIANPPTVPSNVKPEQQHYKQEQYKPEQYKHEQFKSEPSNTSTPVQRSAHPAGDAPPVKQEPGIKYETPQNYPQQGGYGSFNPQVAQQRANHLLQQQYGSQANASIQAAQARQMQMPPNQRPQHIQMPPRPGAGQPQYPQQQPPLSTAQTDGAADNGMQEWKAALAERRAFSEEERAAADHQLRDYIKQSAAFEDSGLLLPVTEQFRKSKKRRNASSSLVVHSEPSASSGPARFDGPDEEESKEDLKKRIEEDEDAINSDLDDSDEDLENVDDDEGNEGPMGETILCTYDKVQRVKNKWKCTLKDGILTTGKKEYVFHKAQGEFEW